MSDSDDKNTGGQNAGPDAQPDAQAEYLKPESGERTRKTRRRKEPPVLDGTAEEVAEEKAAASTPGQTASETDDRGRSAAPGVLVAGLAGFGGAVAALAAVWGAGFLTAGQDGDAVAELGARIEALEGENEGGAQAMSGKLDTLAGRLDAVERKFAVAAEAPESAAAIAGQLEALAAETQQLKAALNDTRRTARAMQQRIDEISASLPPAGIADRVSSLDALTKALDLRLAAFAPEVEKMESRVAVLEEKKDDPDAAARAALGLALANLARAAESPGPFAAELDAVATFLPDEPELAELFGAATKGVPTRAALEARFPSLAQSIFDAERRADEDGLWSRFVSNARSLVTVRRTGEISGDTTEAVVARMEERLKVHDLAGAVTEAEALQGQAGEVAKPWLADANARLQADRLVRDLSARIASRLAKG